MLQRLIIVGPFVFSIMEEHVRAMRLLQVEYDRVLPPQQPDRQPSLDRVLLGGTHSPYTVLVMAPSGLNPSILFCSQ